MDKGKDRPNKKTKTLSGSRAIENAGGELSGENKILIRKECSKNSGLKKRVIIKEDGRYLIYYDF